MDDIIRTDHLTKHYVTVRAVDGISLRVKKGEIYGFLGLNGAGKTTTIRMLLGMIRPTEGSAFMCGQEVNAGCYGLWKNVGYMVEVPYSYPELTVRENLDIVRRLRGLPDKRSVDTVMDKLNLTSYRDRKAKDLSLGNAQRLGLAKALIHDPEILILDEPANGLDPIGIVEVRELFRDLAINHGVTIFISSHILGEISRIATRIGIIHQGKMVQEVDADQLEHLLNKRLIVDALDKTAAQARLIQEGYTVDALKEGALEIKNKDAVAHPENIATILVKAGLPPTLLKVDEEDLESYFLRAIGAEGEVK
jgi:ABC-2 type transport system ATP-binding protein